MATNFEYYKDKILNEFIKEYKMHCFARAMEIATGVEFHVLCESGPCGVCGKKVFEWLYAEHTEQPKLTKRERGLCEYFGNGYIAKDENGMVCWYPDKPEKTRGDEDGCWILNGVGYWKIMRDKTPFNFIAWEDEKPWSVEDLLKLEVEE